MLNQKREQFLDATVMDYIETAEPVGSASLLGRHRFKVSSATVRNHLNELVKEGYLTQRHASSGRVPTEKGYRFYVDQLRTQNRLGFADLEDVQDELMGAEPSMGDILNEVASMLSGLSDYAVLSVVPSSFRRRDYDVRHFGLGNLLKLPEFEDISFARRVVSLLDDSSLLSRVFSMGLRQFRSRVVIGSESESDAFEDCSVVMAPYYYSGKVIGSVGFFGPSRMDYSRMIPMVECVSEMVEARIACRQTA